MRRLRFTLAILGFALIAIPASATISYTYCTSGCSSTGGSYAALQAQPSATGLAFSSPITFVAAGLAGTPAIYTDGTTGAAFNGFNNTTLDSLTVAATVLVQSTSGTGTSIQIVPPTNTYAIAMIVGANAASQPWVELVSSPGSLNTGANAQYQLILNGSNTQFFGIISTTPIASIFVWNGSGGGVLNFQSFEIGEGGVSETSEAATFFTMGGGLLGLYFLRRRISFRLRTPRLRAPIVVRPLLGPQTGVA